MTTEEAIQILRHIVQVADTSDCGIKEIDGIDEEAIDMAIKLILADEVLTPDSSRFWPVDSYQVGKNPPSLDKQFVRDWLDEIGFNRQPPAPELPDEVVRKTHEIYVKAYEELSGKKLV